MSPEGTNQAVVAAGWEPVRAPFSGLREGLAVAEQRLNNPAQDPLRTLWPQLAHSVARDEASCTTALNQLLAAVLHGWRLATDGTSRLELVGRPGIAREDLAAVQAVALFVGTTEWGRFKRCTVPGCTEVVVDRTNGGNRRRCQIHRRLETHHLGGPGGIGTEGAPS